MNENRVEYKRVYHSVLWPINEVAEIYQINASKGLNSHITTLLR